MYAKAAEIIKSANRVAAFTGAGISVESGIPPFRGENGLWNKYDPKTFDIDFFHCNPGPAWKVIQDIFYNLFGSVKPNGAHYALAEMEQAGLLSSVITQNVDHLHHDAGSTIVHEFHGSLKHLVCLRCSQRYEFTAVDIQVLPPTCIHCNGILKPDVIFFGEPIPEPAMTLSFNEATQSDCFLLIGTTGTVMPANMIPAKAKQNNAVIIEINPFPSEYTHSVTDIFIEEKATAAMEKLMAELNHS